MTPIEKSDDPTVATVMALRATVFAVDVADLGDLAVDRAELTSEGIKMLSRTWAAIGFTEEVSAAACLAVAFATGSTHRLHPLLGSFLADWAANMVILNEFLAGHRPAGRDVLDSLLWFYVPKVHEVFAVMPYGEYLLTPYWRCVRAVVLERDGHQCRNCTAATNLHCHHRTYEHRGREHEHLDDLTILCADCHAKFHDRSSE